LLNRGGGLFIANVYVEMKKRYITYIKNNVVIFIYVYGCWAHIIGYCY